MPSKTITIIGSFTHALKILKYIGTSETYSRLSYEFVTELRKGN